MLYFLLNPYIVTGISTKKINKDTKAIPRETCYELLANTDFPLNDIRTLFEYIEKHNTGRDIDVLVCKFYMNFYPNMQDFIKSIITKSLKLGIDAKTVNKVYGKNFIPTFNIQLAKKYFEEPEKVEGKEFTITLKIDGQRCILVKENGKVSMFSRQGQAIEGCIDIIREAENIPADNFILDGEITLLNGMSLSSKEQYKQTLKITRKDGEKHGIKLLVFDILSLGEFKYQKCIIPYSIRRNILTRLDNDILMKYIEILPVLYSGSDTSKISELLNKARKENQEGIMININNALYEFKRTSNLLKVKVMQDCDLKIVGFEEGTGRLKGTLGRINVEYKNSIVGVGSGFTDCDREYFWTHQNKLIGRVVTIQYFEETEDKDGVKSLRFPVFKELRDESKEVSYS